MYLHLNVLTLFKRVSGGSLVICYCRIFQSHLLRQVNRLSKSTCLRLNPGSMPAKYRLVHERHQVLHILSTLTHWFTVIT